MKAASINELKKQLVGTPNKELAELILRLCRYKKENKELLTYLLFEAGNEDGYIQGLKLEIDELFGELPLKSMYQNKKHIRKILRMANKFIRYSGHPQTAVELLIYFLEKVRDSGIPLKKSAALSSLYLNQLNKVKELTEKLHEDLQFDYLQQLRALLDIKGF